LNGTAFSCPTDTPHALSGTGFSREGVGCHTAYLIVVMRASSRLKPVPLIVRVHPFKLVRPNYRTVRSQRDWSRFNSGTGFSRECVRCHTAYLMVFMWASSRLKPVPLIVRVHPFKLVRPNYRTLRSQRDWLRFIVGPALAGKASGVTPHI
jgi:hypothetical protein